MDVFDKAAATWVQISKIREDRTYERQQLMENGQLLSLDDKNDAEHPILDGFIIQLAGLTQI